MAAYKSKGLKYSKPAAKNFYLIQEGCRSFTGASTVYLGSSASSKEDSEVKRKDRNWEIRNSWMKTSEGRCQSTSSGGNLPPFCIINDLRS